MVLMVIGGRWNPIESIQLSHCFFTLISKSLYSIHIQNTKTSILNYHHYLSSDMSAVKIHISVFLDVFNICDVDMTSGI